MFRKILVVTDLSEASDKAVCRLESLKLFGTKEVVLMHCFNVRDLGGLANRMMELYKPCFERQCRTLEGIGFDVKAKMVQGLPQVEINRQADENDCSLVVVASTGTSLSGEILLGGVASEVIHSSARPVLILRSRVADKSETKGCDQVECDYFRNILYATDFSDNAEHAFSFLRKIAERGPKLITLLHVQDQGKIHPRLKDRLEEFNQIDSGRLTRLKEELVAAGAKEVRTEIPYGSPKKEIIARVAGGMASLVVMGSQGRGYMGDVFLGSVSHAVARRSDAPVLLIPFLI